MWRVLLTNTPALCWIIEERKETEQPTSAVVTLVLLFQSEADVAFFFPAK